MNPQSGTSTTTVFAGAAIPQFTVAHVSADRMRMVALLLDDPNPIHLDAEVVVALGLGDREVNQGVNTLAYVYDMLIGWAGSKSAVRRLTCQFRANVFAGDSVAAGGTVLSVTDDGEGPIAECEVWVDRSDGVRVLAGTAAVRVVEDAPGE